MIVSASEYEHGCT